VAPAAAPKMKFCMMLPTPGTTAVLRRSTKLTVGVKPLLVDYQREIDLGDQFAIQGYLYGSGKHRRGRT